MTNSGDSQTEVWDDTALVDSWNEAFEEYKKYHSLAVKGEKVEILAEVAPEQIINGDMKSLDTADDSLNTVASAPEVNKAMPSELHTISSPQVPTPAPAAAAMLTMPQALVASVGNDNMRNLMMSWYYAGYYTGLYEGKQQGYALVQEQRHAS